MRKKVPLLPTLAIIACLVLAFLWSSRITDRKLDELEKQYDANRIRLTQLQNEQTALKKKLDMSETDAFVENQARSLYGYMKKDELRFVITNTDELYAADAVDIVK